MATGANRNFRGWTLAVLTAVALTTLIWFAAKRAMLPGESNTPVAKRTYTIAADTHSNSQRIDSRPDFLESNVLDQDSAWRQYRQRPATNLASSIEPQATISLMAPQLDGTSENLARDLRGGFENDLWLTQARNTRNQFANQSSEFQVTGARSSILQNKKPTWKIDVGSTLTKATQSLNPSTLWPVPTILFKRLDELLTQSERANATAAHLISLQRAPADLVQQPSDFEADAFQDKNVAIQLKQWVAQIRSHLKALDDNGSANTLAASDTLNQLEILADQLLNSTTAWPDSKTTELAARSAYAIKRRTQLWKGVYACLQNAGQPSLQSVAAFNAAELSQLVDSVRHDAKATGDVKGWEIYLQLDKLAKIAAAPQRTQQETATVRTVLDRVSWRGLTKTQHAFLEQASVKSLADCIQPLAITPIDYQQLLHDFEVLENEPLHRCSGTVIAALESLRYSNDRAQIALSTAINTYYRNANLRIAIADELINRFMPEQESMSRPVRERILGAHTTGASTIDNDLKISLIADPQAWHIRLNLTADINSRTSSEKGPATVHSRGQIQVESGREIIISADQMRIKPGQSNISSSNTHTRGIETSFDSLPLLGSMVRQFVDREVREQMPIAKRVTANIISRQTDAEFDSQLQTQVRTAQTQMEDRVIKPLQFLGLDSDVVDLRTTDSRLIARYRLATNNTMAAHTPRPQAPSDSLLSIQVHQSSFNNACNQMRLGEHDWTINELIDELSQQLHLQVVFDQSQLPEGVSLRFEKENPLTLEFVDDTIYLTLRFANLNQNGRINLNNFIIRVSYVAQADGLQTKFIRTGAVSVDGERLGMRDRLPLRAIFGRIFAGHSEIRLLNEQWLTDPRLQGLAVSQIVAREGWLALAISETKSLHVAKLQSSQVVR